MNSMTPLVGPPVSRVVVTDIDMPFGSMVGFMVKWAIATIPAMLILLLAGLGIVGFFTAIGAGLF